MKRKIAAAMPRLGRFIPTMQPTYATYDEVMEAHGDCTRVEIKHDGYRVQVHKGKKRLRIFTRNGNELNYRCYPDIVKAAKALPVGIVDAEMVGDGETHKETYDNVKARFRRPGIKQETVDEYLRSGIVSATPLSLMVFDTLRFESKGLLDLPLSERDRYTQNIFSDRIEPVDFEIIRSVSGLESAVDAAFQSREEGVICKDPGSLYHPGGNGIDWVKFKRYETLDLAVVGFYLNESTELPFMSVLCATYNSETGMYETLGKIGVTRDGIANEIDAKVKGMVSNTAPGNVAFSAKLDRESHASHVPDLYIDPDESVVLEVRAMNLYRSANWQTCGLQDGRAFSMRIGYAGQLRPDKSPRQATTTQAVWKLYDLQSRGG